MHRSPLLDELGTYPFARLDDAKRRLGDAGVPIIDFGVGDPREPTAPVIRKALVDGMRETMPYPMARGLPELREAIAAWLARRFDVSLDPDQQIIPTLGAKEELIFSLAQIVVDPGEGRDLVITTEPGYPVAERGARFAGAEVLRLPLLESKGYLPDVGAVDEAVWRRVALVWINYPNNPTGIEAPHELYERLGALAVQHDFLLASDEAYTELYFSDPPGSALQAGCDNVIAVHSLSKRSSMTGYRCGFVAGSAEAVAALRLFRPSVGTAPQEFVQRAAVAAWNDESHVEETRERYARKRALLLPVLERKGYRNAGGPSTMYLWIALPDGVSSESFAIRLLEHGLVVAPGSYLGPSGEGYVRFALVPTEQQCQAAVSILEEVL